MAQRVFVRVSGFTDVERHALNSVFRLSERSHVTYSPWDEDAPAKAELALVDGDAEGAQAEAQAALAQGLKLYWVGRQAPQGSTRTFQRPLSWSDVVMAMDEEFMPGSPIEFDLDFDSVDTEPPTEPQAGDPEQARRALIVGRDRDERLYMRAKLSLAHWTRADEAETGAQALEMAREYPYQLALVDRVPDLVDPWDFVTELRSTLPSIRAVVLILARPTLLQKLRAHRRGAIVIRKPPHPGRLHRLLGALSR